MNKIKKQTVLAIKDEYNFGFAELLDEHSEADLEHCCHINIKKDKL